MVRQHLQVFFDHSHSFALPILSLIIAYVLVPMVADEYVIESLLLPFLALSLAAVGLNLLTGSAGQLSLGTAAFMAVGAYAAYNIVVRLPGIPMLLAFALGGLAAALLGILFGLPSLRLRGFYLAVSTLAAQFFVQWVFTKFSWFSADNSSGVISAPHLRAFGFVFTDPAARYLYCLSVVVLLTMAASRLLATTTGKHFIAIRDNELVASIIGVPVLQTKITAFALSSFIIGVAGALWAFAYIRTVEPHGFNLDRSFQILFIIIIGGLGSIRGSFLGSAFIVVLPLLLSRLGSAVFGGSFDSGVVEMFQRMLVGSLIILFLIVEPEGLVAIMARCGLALRRVFKQA
ncbi:MAG: branched-chain amino acid ABC transporter permease [Cyanobacteriota bacterium]